MGKTQRWKIFKKKRLYLGSEEKLNPVGRCKACEWLAQESPAKVDFHNETSPGGGPGQTEDLGGGT